MRKPVFTAVALVAAAFLSGCAYTPKPAVMSKLPVYPLKTVSQSMLNDLPPPEHPIAVAVYGFNDQTGQFKLTTTGQTLSRAVSQGGSAVLVRSLEQAGNRSWFTIVEREQLKDLLNERQLIREMRSQYLGEKNVNPQALPALLFAGVLLEGGVVGYDTNTVTGGVGATLLGIGGDAKYQQDTVTVYLRAVSVKTGEVLTSVTASKTITSYAVDANVFRYIGATSLLETENGFTTNEPAMLAMQQAIDKAVYSLVMEGVDLKLWNFADTNAGWPALWRYRQERDGVLSPQQVAAAEAKLHGGWRASSEHVSADVPPPPPPPSAASARYLAPAPHPPRLASASPPPVNARAELSRPVTAPPPTAQAPPRPATASASASDLPSRVATTDAVEGDPVGDLIEACCHPPEPSGAGVPTTPVASS
jgi:curli production assembly/transport component CsgG